MNTLPVIIRTQNALRAQIRDWRLAKETIAFVPTMGALHEGHLSLIRLAQKKADKVVVSIFVNPTQFAPGEDFDAYPRTEKTDTEKLATIGCDLVYIPRSGSMYNAHHATHIKVGGVADGLETDHRPTFFEGVALIVTKLFNRVQPDIAVFGEKDYQQLATIRRLVEDLDMPIDIIGAPIARDAHGLALSSRNQYFDDNARLVAQKLNSIMFESADKLAQGGEIAVTISQAREALLKAGFSAIDYISVANANNLELQTHGQVKFPARLLIAAHCHNVRLIDNCAIPPQSPKHHE